MKLSNVTTFHDWIITTMIISKWSELRSPTHIRYLKVMLNKFFMNFKNSLVDLACLVFLSRDKKVFIFIIFFSILMQFFYNVPIVIKLILPWKFRCL